MLSHLALSQVLDTLRTLCLPISPRLSALDKGPCHPSRIPSTLGTFRSLAMWFLSSFYATHTSILTSDRATKTLTDSSPALQNALLPHPLSRTTTASVLL